MRSAIAFESRQFLAPVGRLGKNESIYSLLSRNAIAFPGWREGQAKPSYRNLFESACLNIDRVATQCGVSAEWLSMANGWDMYGWGHHPSNFEKYHLRYCAACMANSYHSPIFQHFALHRCPAHSIELRGHCPSCKCGICPTETTLEQAPFECPRCNFDLRRSKFAFQDRASVSEVDRVLDKVRVDLRLGGADRDVSLSIPNVDFPDRPRSAVSARHWQRALIFTTNERQKWFPSFRETKICLREVGPNSLSLVCELAQWLRKCCGCAEHVDYLLAKTATPGGMIAPAGASLLGMLIYRFVCLYRIRDEFTLGVPRRWHFNQAVRYGTRPSKHSGIDGRVLQLEMLGYLAVELARHLRTRLMTAEAWNRNIDPMTYAPTVFVDEKASYARIRYRADEEQVLRLIRRFPDMPYLLA